MAFAALVTLVACGGGSGDDVFDPDANDSCEVEYQNQWVYNNMRDYYLFYDQVPVVNPQSYATPEDLLKDIRFEERDPFSFLTDASASSLQFEEGREFGLGYRWGRDNDENARILQVVDASPFGLAGIERGDIIVAVDGLDWQDEALAEIFDERIVGTVEAPGSATWRIEKRDTGELVDLQITSTEYAINSVEAVSEITPDNHDGTIGYFVFHRFLETSEAELLETFQQFSDSGISDLVVDLRYNRGGRVYIAELLASLIAGDSRAGSLLYNYRFNDKYQENNYDLVLRPDLGGLNLSRVVFLTRSATASSSEIVTSGLQPYMDVVTVGSLTAGKPYVQRGRDRCGLRLNAIEAEGFNAAGVSVFGGVPATCKAEDDRSHDFGLNNGVIEGMLKSGLDYLTQGHCDTGLAAKSSARSAMESADTDERQGFTVLDGAAR